MQPSGPPTDAPPAHGCTWPINRRFLNWKEDRMKPHRTRFLAIPAVAAAAAMV